MPLGAAFSASVLNHLLDRVRAFGQITESRLYSDSMKGTLPAKHRDVLEQLGVTLIDCPAIDKKEAADKKIILDVCFWALPRATRQQACTVVLLSGDADFTHMLSKLRAVSVRTVVVLSARVPARSALRSALPRPVRTFKFKGELAFVLQEERLRIGVEVGVFEGRFSRWMLDNWKACEAYYMVDLWAPQDHYRQMDAASLAENLQRMQTARKQVAPYAAKATLVRNSSTLAAAGFADASVDFVYLDARHTYDAVTEDLEAWWPKLRAGGLLAGEDYMESDEVWMMTATCDFGPRRLMYPWSGCQKWDLPRGTYFDCKPRRECENATRGSAYAESIRPPCGSDYSLQADGTRRKDNKAVRSAVDEFAKRHGRQVQLAYRDPQRAFMWNTYAIRR